MKNQLTKALQTLKDKGGKARQAAIKAEIIMEYSEMIADVIANGEFWRIETVIGVFSERLKAASRPQFKEGGTSCRMPKGVECVPLAANFYGEYMQRPLPPQCSTYQVGTGKHCPGEPKHKVDGYLFCDKCHLTVLNRLARETSQLSMIKPRVIGNTYDVPNLDITKK